MKKTLALILVLTMSISMLAGYGSSASAASETSSVTENAKAPVYETMFLIGGNAGQDGDSLDTAMDYFVEEFGKRTNGAVTGDVTASSGLGGHSDMISAVQMGSIQVAEATASVLSTVAPKFAVFDIPYMAPGDANTVYELLSGEAGEILNKDLIDNAGLRVIAWMCRTPRHVYSASRPVATLEDWNGMKIRTMQASAMIKAMGLLKAAPQAIPTAERYMALQTGVVEAAENNVAEIYNCKEYEVTKYLSKTGHMCAPNVMYVSEAWFQSLSPEYQEMVIEIGKEAGRLATDIECNSEADFESKLVSEGNMTVNELSEEELNRIREALAPLYAEYESVLGADLISLFQGN